MNLKPSLKIRWPLALIVVVITLAIAVSFAATFVPTRGVRFDFYVHYMGARALWQGENPYTEAVAAQIQLDMFGQRITEGSNQHYVAYPAYAHVLLLPFSLLPPTPALVIWVTLQMTAILLAPLLWVLLLRARPSALVLAGLIFGLVFVFRHTMNAIVIGQFTGTMLLLLTLGVWALAARRDVLAGVLLAFATIPPTISGPLTGGLLLLLAVRGRWRGLAAFTGTLALLTAVSVALVGWWLPDFLAVARAYAGYANTVWGLGALPFPLAMIAGGAALVLSAWAAVRYWQQPDDTAVLVEMFLTFLGVSVLVLPQTGGYVLTLLVPLLVAIFMAAGAYRRWLRLLVVLVIASPWLFFRLKGPLQPLEGSLIALAVVILWAVVVVPGWVRGQPTKPTAD